MSNYTTNGQPAELLDRQPPCDPDAEKMVLRAIVLDGRLINAAADLTAEHFSAPAHRAIFAALATLRENQQPIDIGHLDQQLRDNEALADIGGRAYLADVLAGEPLPALTDHYLRAVRDKYARRQALHAATSLIQRVYSDVATADVLGDARARLDGLALDAGCAPPTPITAQALVSAHPHLHEPIIDGLLRRGETANIIAAPKMGKSWLSYGLALSVVAGDPWLGRYECRSGRVLLVDNELHAETLAHRLRRVADAMGLSPADYAAGLDVLPLRGRGQSLHGIASLMERIEPGTYDLAILDAWYRALPGGISENDNASVAALYNIIDAITARLGCAWINIHHASKGSQADKNVTDIGAGAGAQSRAADTHLVLRPHEDEGAVVLEAVVRSFPPVAPLVLRWDFPLWTPADDLDPRQVRGRLSGAEQKANDRDKAARDQILAALVHGPQVATYFRALLGAGPDRTMRLLGRLEIDGAVMSREQPGRGRTGTTRLYWLADSPEPGREGNGAG